MNSNPILAIDAYKLDHRRQYPAGTTRVYSNFTPRGSRVAGVDRVVFFGLQAFLKDYCVDQFGQWFARPEDEAVDEYVAFTARILGPNDIGGEHIRALHRLGYLPLRFCALPEGTLTPLRVPMFTVENTHPEFFWLTNYIESVLSAQMWLPCTSATSAWRLRRLLDAAARRTGGAAESVDWQGHDFSLRGMQAMSAAAASGAGHLLSFTGTDSLPAVEFVDEFYPGADNGFVGGSVAATEHSVMSAGGRTSELETYSRILDLYRSGIVSVVSDTWSLWDVITEILPALKERIMARDGKLVIRPDSGDPADIICGDPHADPASPAAKGVARLLYELFGGTINDRGFIDLDPHIGMIYGDSITYDRAKDITERLEANGFASTNIVLGVGSFTYTFVTRDTFGFAMKATYVEIDGRARDLFKAPVTDDGVKKSATGRLAVRLTGDRDGAYLVERATPLDEKLSALQPVWENGRFIRTQSFADVRATLREQTNQYELMHAPARTKEFV